jgi:hypothetical protein
VRILTILARYGSELYAGGERTLADLFAVQLPSVARDVVIVDSALPRGVHHHVPGRTIIGGDNSFREFSAIDDALEHVGSAIWDYDLINLATAALGEFYTGYLERFQLPVLRAILGRPVCIGHIDCYNDAIEVLGYRSQHWLRTSCVFLPPAELRMLPSLQSSGKPSRWFSGVPGRPFRDDAPLSSNYRQLIIGWLTGEDIGQGVRRSARLTIDAPGRAAFEHKAQAILNEHLFSIRLRAAGCRTIDVTWLSSVINRGESIDWSTEWWLQLAHRDRDHVYISPSEGVVFAASTDLQSPEPVRGSNTTANPPPVGV